MRAITLLGAMATATLLVPATAPDARACGGCFHEPTPPNETGTVVTDHQMIFVTSPMQTTLYDMIKYSGAPSSFAWVLPIHGTVTVGLSSDSVFASLNQLTQPQFIPPPYPVCPVPANCPACGGGFAENAGTGSSGGSSSGSGPTVNVLTQAVVGPYDTVQLQSTDPMALNTWLTANGYVIPMDVMPIIAAYVQEGFNFLALRLAPGQGVQAMRPVSVTSTGAGVALPLRMVAVGTGATVGITLWVLSGGRYEPQNFVGFTIAPSDIVWDWSTSSSNYTTLQQQKETSLNNAAWQTESSLDISPMAVENLVLNGSQFGGSSSGGPAIPATTEGYTGADAGASGVTPELQREADLATLFPGGGTSVRVTRMRADLSHAALTNDLVLQASADQSQVSNQYTITQSINAPPCPDPPVCPCGGGFGGSTSGGLTSSGGIGGGGYTSSSSGGSSSGSSHGDSFGCAASPNESGRDGLELVLGGLVGVAMIRSRMRRKPR
jgi:hypothetical protein